VVFIPALMATLVVGQRPIRSREVVVLSDRWRHARHHIHGYTTRDESVWIILRSDPNPNFRDMEKNFNPCEIRIIQI
jgi:hypothetical protein